MGPDKKPRRWLAISLRALFVVVTVAALWFEWQAHIVGRRRAMLDSMIGHGAFFTEHKPGGSLGWTLWMRTRFLSDVNVCRVFLPRTEYTEKDVEEVKEVFPEAQICRGYGRWDP